MRLPRPLGFTEAVQQAVSTEDSALLQTVKSRAIQLWLLSRGNIFGQSLSAADLSLFLKVPLEAVNLHMRDMFLSTQIWDPKQREQLTNALTGQLLAWSIEDKMEVDNQVDTLKRAQGQTYKPFITSELNKILSTKLSSTKSVVDLLKTLTAQPTINLTQNQTNNYLTLEQAVNLIQREDSSNNSLTPQDSMFKEEVDYLTSHYNTEDLPNITPTIQQEDISSLNQEELRQITDSYKETMLIANREHHEIRRELELNIHPDDPTI